MKVLKAIGVVTVLFFAIFADYSAVSADDPETVLVEVPGYANLVMGKFGGTLGESTEFKRPFYSFRSLAYAASPTNERRFLPPVPSNYPYPNDEIYNSNVIEFGCPQSDWTNEDCLIVTVYTPYLPGNASNPNTRFDRNLPVMYWIYGGSFVFGQTIIYQPQTFMDYDVVIVQVQYRLGALGWLSLDTDEVPGNAGLFDQIEGLRWTQKFVKYFGGDPNRVTIMGESAGAASVSLLLLAPQARGLFHGAIAQSGSMLTDWALDRDSKKSGMKIAEYAGCPLEPYEDLLHCLRTVDVLVLKEAQRKYSREDMKNGGLGFVGQSPVIQRAGAQRALTREPRAVIEDGDYSTEVRIMFGANKHEGTYVADVLLDGFIRPNGLENDEEFLRYGMIPTLLSALRVSDDSRSLTDVLYTKYFSYALEAGQQANLTYLMLGIVDLGGALFLKAGGWETVRLHSRHNPGSAYWYSFDYRGKFQLIGTDEMVPPGVGHADEIQYLWNVPLPKNTSELNLCVRMRQTWVNFITYGDPTPDSVPLMNGVPKFPAYTTESKSFMAINDKWEVRSDYTNYYTVSVDDFFPDRKGIKESDNIHV